MRRNHLFLHFPLSHLQYIKNFIDDFYTSSCYIYSLNMSKLLFYYRFNVICDSLLLPLWYEWTIRELFPSPFNWVRYVGFNFNEFPKVAILDTCSFYMLKDSRWRWNQHPKVYIRRRNKMICPSCFEGCLFCQAICFVDKIVQRIKFIHFNFHWTVTKFLKDIEQCCLQLLLWLTKPPTT